MTQAFLPMIRAARGRVVFMSSIGARRARSPSPLAYNASKSAIGIVGDSLRQEMRPFGVEVSIIEPGAIATPIWGKGQAEAPDIIAAMDPGLRELYAERLDASQGLSAKTEPAARRPTRSPRPSSTRSPTRSPSARYVVGLDAKIQALAGTLLPDRALDRVIERELDRS